MWLIYVWLLGSTNNDYLIYLVKYEFIICLSFLDGTVSILQPHNESPEFSHIVTLLSNLSDKSPLSVIDGFVELHPDFKLNKDLKYYNPLIIFLYYLLMCTFILIYYIK